METELPYELVLDILEKLDYVSLKSYCDTYSELRNLCSTPRIKKLLEEKKREYLKIRIGNPPYRPFNDSVYVLADKIESDVDIFTDDLDVALIDNVNFFYVFLDGHELNRALEEYYEERREEGYVEEEGYFPEEMIVLAFFGLLVQDWTGGYNLSMLYLDPDGQLTRYFLPLDIEGKNIWFEDINNYPSKEEDVFPVYYFSRENPKLTEGEITNAIEKKDFYISESINFITDESSLALYEYYIDLLGKT